MATLQLNYTISTAPSIVVKANEIERHSICQPDAIRRQEELMASKVHCPCADFKNSRVTVPLTDVRGGSFVRREMHVSSAPGT
jgi:hypothetical protein